MRQLWILTLLAFLAAAQGPDRAAVQLQGATKMEVFDGNLKGAIEQYRKIIDTYKSNRPVVAEALVRMAQCYEKLGDVQAREARGAYERVVREFVDQAEPAAQARARLAALASSDAGAAATESSGTRIRQVWADTPGDIDPFGSPSPDGRSFVYFSGDGDLMIRDLTTGMNRHVTSLIKDTPGAIADTPRWSPLGDVLAYAWYLPRQPVPKEGERVQLRLYDLKADKTRILMSSKDPYPMAWSGDGKHILTTYRENGIRVLGMVSLDAGTIRPVKRLSSGQASIYGGDLSPDGKFIAYAESPRQSEPNYDLVVLDAATGQETCRIGHPAEEILLGWSRDGRYLLFLSNRTGTQDLWVQRVENGKAVSDPELIKTSVGRLFPLGFSASGAFFYLTRNAGTDIYLSEADFSSGTITKPQKLILDHEGSNSNCTFSPDGRYLAYLTFRGTVDSWGPGIANPLQDTICVYSFETGRIRQYLAQMRMSYFPSSSLEWSSDSRYLFFQAATPPENSLGKKSLYKLDITNGEIGAVGNLKGYHVTSDGKTLIADFDDIENMTWRLVRRDLQTGVETELYRREASYKGAARLSGGGYYLGSDEKAVFLHLPGPDRTWRVVRRDIQTGAETELSRGSGPPVLPTLSPDNRFLAFRQSEKSAEGKVRYNLALISTTDGTRKVVFPGSSGPVYWIPGGHSLLMSGPSNPEGANLMFDLWQVPVDGHAPRKFEPRVSNLLSLAVHPDGKRIAFTLGQYISRQYQIWVMENYLPPAKESRK